MFILLFYYRDMCSLEMFSIKISIIIMFVWMKIGIVNVMSDDNL